ncbi:hypothetical protein ACW675_07035 [Corynebacterium aurimucosum]
MNEDFRVWHHLMTVETRCEMAIVSLSGIVEEVDFTRFLISSSGIKASADSLDTVSGIACAIKRELESISDKAHRERVKRQGRIIEAIGDYA